MTSIPFKQGVSLIQLIKKIYICRLEGWNGKAELDMANQITTYYPILVRSKLACRVREKVDVGENYPNTWRY